MDEQNYTPLPKKPEVKFNMNFANALFEIIQGKKVTKMDWKDKNVYGFMKDDILMLRLADGLEHRWIVSKSDITGQDYLIVKDEN